MSKLKEISEVRSALYLPSNKASERLSNYSWSTYSMRLDFRKNMTNDCVQGKRELLTKVSVSGKMNKTSGCFFLFFNRITKSFTWCYLE